MVTAELTALLARNGMFAHLDPAALAALADQLVWFCLPGGRALLKTGEPASALYLLKSGSLGVFERRTTGERARLVHLVAAGETVGEISLLGGETHRRSVRALRDSELLRLDRCAFEALVGRHASAMLGVAQVAIARLQQDQRQQAPPDMPRTFALLPVHAGVAARALAMQLAMALRDYGECAVIDAAHGAGRGSDWFAAREQQVRFVIYLDTDNDPSWRRRCLRQADVLLLPAPAAEPARPWPEPVLRHASPLRHRPRHLILLHADHRIAAGAAQRWRAQFGGELQHHHVGNAADIERLARLVSGHGRGLVLAGGGARGLAHLGALRALREAGHTFDAIGGTSIGAIIGAGVAGEWDTETLLRVNHEAFVKGKPLSDWTLPLVALTRGRRATRLLRAAFGTLAIEDLPLPFFCVCTELSGSGMQVRRHGPLWLWLRASSSIPGILPPVLHRGGVYVDGALINNLPTDVMANAGIDHITALDVRGGETLTSRIEEAFTPPWWQLLWQRRHAVGRPGLATTLMHAAMVNSDDANVLRRERADLLIAPRLEHVGLLDWKDWQRIVDTGYREAVSVLEGSAAPAPR